MTKTYYLLAKFQTEGEVSKERTHNAIVKALNESSNELVKMQMFELEELTN
jgi:hypothetical protein